MYNKSRYLPSIPLLYPLTHKHTHVTSLTHTLLQDLESSRQVDFEEVLDYCKHINCPVLETSAKTGLNVTESFRLLLDRVAELSPTKFKDCIILPPEPSQQNHRRRCVIS